MADTTPDRETLDAIRREWYATRARHLDYPTCPVCEGEGMVGGYALTTRRPRRCGMCDGHGEIVCCHECIAVMTPAEAEEGACTCCNEPIGGESC